MPRLCCGDVHIAQPGEFFAIGAAWWKENDLAFLDHGSSERAYSQVQIIANAMRIHSRKQQLCRISARRVLREANVRVSCIGQGLMQYGYARCSAVDEATIHHLRRPWRRRRCLGHVALCCSQSAGRACARAARALGWRSSRLEEHPQQPSADATPRDCRPSTATQSGTTLTVRAAASTDKRDGKQSF